MFRFSESGIFLSRLVTLRIRESNLLRQNQRTQTYFLRGSINVWLTSCSLYLDSAALLVLNLQQIYLFGQIQTSQTEVSDTVILPLTK